MLKFVCIQLDKCGPLCVSVCLCHPVDTHTQRQLALMKVFGCSAVSVQFSLQKIGSGCLNW